MKTSSSRPSTSAIREDTGRRRRVYRITRSGQTALRQWLADPTGSEVQYRSLALLKLFFGRFSSIEDVAALAASQVELYTDMLAHYDGIIDRLKTSGDRPWQLAVGELLLDAHRAAAEHWKRIARRAAQEAGSSPPRNARKSRGRAAAP